MSKTKRFTAILLSAVMLCSAFSTEFMQSQAGNTKEATKTPAETKTWTFNSEQSVKDLLADKTVALYQTATKVTPTYDATNQALMLAKEGYPGDYGKASILVPQAYTDSDNLVYPVNGIEGKVQLGAAGGFHGVAFVYDKVTNNSLDTYRGSIVNISATSSGTVLYLHKGTYAEQENGSYVSTFDKKNIKSYSASTLMQYIKDEISTDKKQELLTKLEGVKTRAELEALADNCWITFKLHANGKKPMLEMTLKIEGTPYTFDVPFDDTIIDTKTYGFGHISFAKYWDNVFPQVLIKEMTACYDLSEFYEQFTGEIEQKITKLGTLTRDKYEQMQTIYSKYEALPEEQKAYVKNIDKLKKALEAFDKGAYFYDDFEGALNWKLAGEVPDTDLEPTNTYSEDALKIEGNEDKEAFWGTHEATDEEGNQVLWLRKSFNSKNVRPVDTDNQKKPSVIAITKDILPGNAKITSVSGRMYIKNYNYGRADYKQFIGLTYKYSSENTWNAIGHKGCYYGGNNISGVDRTSASSGRIPNDFGSRYAIVEGGNFDLKADQWIDFTLEYDFAMGCYTYEAKGIDKNSEAVSIKVKIPEATELMPEIGLLNASECAQSFDNISVSILGSSYAEGKINELPAVEQVTLDDEVQILTIQKILERLSQEEKNAISQEAQEKYEAVKSRYEYLLAERDGGLSIDSLITFEDGQAGKAYFESVNASGILGCDTAENPKKDAVNGSDKVLKISRNYNASSSTDNNRAVYKIKGNLMKGEQLLSNYSGKVFLQNGKTATIIYDYESDTKWLGYQLTMNASGAITVQEITKNGTGNLSASPNKPQGLRCETTSQSLTKEEAADGAWVSFNVEYRLLSAQLTVSYKVDNKEYISQYSKWNVLLDTCETQVGVATGNDAYFDDIKLNFKSEDAYNQKKAFVEKYDYLLDLVPVSNYLSVTDKDDVEGIIADYAALDDTVKNHMPFMGVKVANIEAAWKKIDEDSDAAKRDEKILKAKESAKEGYTDYTFEDDFENGLSAWMPASFDSINDGSVSLTTHEGFSGKVVKLSEKAILTPKSTFLPNKAQMVSVSYKILKEKNDNAYYDMQIFGSYLSENSFSGYGINNNRAVYTYGNILSIDHANSSAELHYLDATGILDVKIEYTAAGKYFIQITDENGKSYETSTKTSSLRSLLAIGSWSYAGGGATYIDDVKVVYHEGAYDVDEVTEDITVYYSGNTFQSADDYVTLSGDNLAETVKEVWIAPLENNAAGDKAFVSQESFDTAGPKDGEYSQNAVAHNFNQANAVKVDIIQKTTDSLKFKMPETTPQQAVYAVKLVGNKAADKVIYMNQPSIDYTVGSDGDLATQGTELRVIGKNLAPAKDASKVKAVFVSQETKASYNATVTEVQSVYSVSVTVPAGIPNGNYEVWLHSGVGDNTAWSVPTIVKVGTAVRDTWSSTVYNIQTDFGATGKSTQNATPCFVNALAAIEKNGGGILYLPQGNYCIEYILQIPENCRIIGESKDTTSISLRPYNFAYNHLPNAIFEMTRNVEISNVSILTSRVGGVFGATGGKNDNIYLTDILVEIEPETGSPTDGMNHIYTDLVTPDKQKEMIASETVSPIISIDYGKNVQIKKVDMGFCKGRNRPIVSDTSGNTYWQVSDTVQTGEWCEVIINYSIWENNQHGPDNCIGVWGHGTYMQGNVLSNRTVNNRELYVADRAAKYIGTGTLDANDQTRIILNGVISDDLARVGQLYIREGQGAGQVRTVVDCEQITVDGIKCTVLILDSAFYVQPNRNSILVFRKPRENIYFVDMDFSYGSSCGFYGGAADVIYDNCSFTGVQNIYQQARVGDVNWYFSIINSSVKRADFLGTAGSASETIGINWRSESTNGQRCFLLRDCVIDGQYTQIDSGTGTDKMKDMVIQRNQFKNMEYAFVFTASPKNGKDYSMDGFLMAENIYTNVDYMYSDSSVSIVDAAKNTTNDATSRRLMVIDSQDESVVRGLVGDVNGDGMVSLKDASMIMFYVAGETTLSNSQLLNGDVNGDGVTNLKDASLIKFYEAGKIDVFPAETTKGEENE